MRNIPVARVEGVIRLLSFIIMNIYMSASQAAAGYRINGGSAHEAWRAKLFPAACAKPLPYGSFGAAVGATDFCLYSFHFVLHFAESS